MIELLAILCSAAFLAGLTDSMVGGGGLVQLPILLIVFPHMNQASVLGTNKMSSVWGTAAAAITYTRRVKLDWALTAVCSLLAFAFSRIGAQAAAHVQLTLFKPFVLVLLILMAGFTFFHKDFGAMSHDRIVGASRSIRGALIGAGIGFYDGFFGPGTGSILIFLFIGAIGLDFLGASATAKVVNLCTNIGALTYFVLSGHVLYRYAIPMAACNIAGGIIGAHVAINHGNRLVRIFFIAIILAIIARYAVDVAPIVSMGRG